MRRIVLLIFILFTINYVFSEKLPCIRKEGFFRIIIPISAYKKTKKRILLIGDSITLDYYDSVKSEFPDYAVCLFSTSACGCSGCYRKYLKFILSSTYFDVIHFNNSTLHCLYETDRKFKKTLKSSIRLIKRYQPDACIILATATYTTDNGLNKKVVEKNRIIREIAKKYNLVLDDLFTITKKSKNIHRDRLHFNDRGITLLGKAVSTSIKSCVEKKQ